MNTEKIMKMTLLHMTTKGKQQNLIWKMFQVPSSRIKQIETENNNKLQ
jgi:hypothetical protein